MVKGNELVDLLGRSCMWSSPVAVASKTLWLSIDFFVDIHFDWRWSMDAYANRQCPMYMFLPWMYLCLVLVACFVFVLYFSCLFWFALFSVVVICLVLFLFCCGSVCCVLLCYVVFCFFVLFFVYVFVLFVLHCSILFCFVVVGVYCCAMHRNVVCVMSVYHLGL